VLCEFGLLDLCGVLCEWRVHCEQHVHDIRGLHGRCRRLRHGRVRNRSDIGEPSSNDVSSAEQICLRLGVADAHGNKDRDACAV
jgi:hypothetical protein